MVRFGPKNWFLIDVVSGYALRNICVYIIGTINIERLVNSDRLIFIFVVNWLWFQYGDVNVVYVLQVGLKFYLTIFLILSTVNWASQFAGFAWNLPLLWGVSRCSLIPICTISIFWGLRIYTPDVKIKC